MIRKAYPSDIDGIVAVYNSVFDYEDKHICYTNWQKGKYPSADFANKAICNGSMFVCEEDGMIVSSMLTDSHQLDEYAKINWHFPAAPDEVSVIHTLCVHSEHYKKGIAKRMIAFAEEYSKHNGKKVIRLDTYENNIPAIKMYSSLCYTYAGMTEFFFMGYIRENLKCFEKLL